MKSKVMGHAARLRLIHKPLEPVRRLPPSYLWGGTMINDFFGEHLDARKKDRTSIYEGAAERELVALIGDLDDAVELRTFVESQTRSRRARGSRGAWA